MKLLAVAFSLLSLLAIPSEVEPLSTEDNEIVLHQQGYQLTFTPQSGQLLYTSQQGDQEVLSDSSFFHETFHISAQNDSSVTISYPEQQLNCSLVFRQSFEVSIQFSATRPQAFTWPSVSIIKDSDFLIWPQNGGYYIPFSDSLFSARFDDRSFTASELSLPFWAVEQDSATLMYEMVSPFRNSFEFHNENESMELRLEHTFPDNSALENPYEIIITRVNNESPISAALHFRALLKARNELVTFKQKTESVPLNERMIGAPFIRLISGQFITSHDIKAGRMVSLAQAMVIDLVKPETYVAKNWINLDESEQRAITELAISDHPSKYQEKAFVRALNTLLNTEGVNAEFANNLRTNAEILYQTYPEYLFPPSQWGRGVSIRMIDSLKEAGIDKAILQAIGHNIASDRKEVASYAVDQGYLYGIYDSYHSVHPFSSFGTDDSWETAQMPGVEYDSVRMQRQDGSYYGGFRAEGGKANPIAIREYFQDRINSNFSEVPYSYYFIDCDAFGEYQDDYSTLHPLTKEEDAAERLDRLSWLRTEKQVPIGSEKGISLFANVLDINEGVATPLFGFWDKDMRDKNSRFYKGSYWPPEMMGIDFKEVPLKEKYVHLFFDPRFKIPLWETVYHDCLISTAHPYTPSLKFINIRTELALTEMFYQYPPVYNLNVEYFHQHKDRIVHHDQFFSAAHPQTIHKPLTAFAFLSEDRLVQRIQFGAIELIANYDHSIFQFESLQIPPHTVLFIDENGQKSFFSPEGS